MLENPPPRASLPSKPAKLPYVFELWPAVRLPPKPRGQLGIQYVTGAAWAWAVRPPRQSAANTNARPILPAKMDIHATASVLKLYAPGFKNASPAPPAVASNAPGFDDKSLVYDASSKVSTDPYLLEVHPQRFDPNAH